MQRLTGSDAQHLYGETRSQHGHTCKIAVVDVAHDPDGYTFERVKEALADRAHVLPPFRWRLVPVPGSVLPPAVGRRGRPAPRRAGARRPGWRRRAGGGSCARWCPASPASRSTARSPSGSCGSSRAWPTARSASWRRCTTPSPTAWPAPSSSSTPCRSTPRRRWSPPPSRWRPTRSRARAGCSATPSSTSSACSPASPTCSGAPPPPPPWPPAGARSPPPRPVRPFTGPMMRFNRPLTPNRIYACTTLPLADVRAVKDELGCTLNDVVLAMAGGALRSWLTSHRGAAASSPSPPPCPSPCGGRRSSGSGATGCATCSPRWPPTWPTRSNGCGASTTPPPRPRPCTPTPTRGCSTTGGSSIPCGGRTCRGPGGWSRR